MPWLQAPFLLPSSSQSHHPKCRRNPEGHGLSEHGCITRADQLAFHTRSYLAATSQEVAPAMRPVPSFPPAERQTPHFGAGVSKQTNTLKKRRVHTQSLIPHTTEHFTTLTVTKFSFQTLFHNIPCHFRNGGGDGMRTDSLHFNIAKLMSRSPETSKLVSLY